MSAHPLANTLADAEAGDRKSLARLISAAERGEALPNLPLGGIDDPQRLTVGITGAPGAGKSTLVSALTHELLKTEASVAALAVDPSSPISRGALLGDRVRMQRHATAPNVFIRSMATRANHGGLASATQAARRLLQHCHWPLVIIETVGVGQVELDIVNTADIAVVVLNPGWGDEIQANKAGLMEIADVFVINKADRPGLEATRRDIEAVLINKPEASRPAVIDMVATDGVGVGELARELRRLHQRLLDSGELARRRQQQLHQELQQETARRFESMLRSCIQEPDFAERVDALAAGRLGVGAAAETLLEDVLARVTGQGPHR